MKILENECEVQEKCYHLKIEYENNLYFFIVDTLKMPKKSHKENIMRIRRCVCFWDCGKDLRAKDLKAIRNHITENLLKNDSQSNN